MNVLLGVGNELMGDDGIGPAIVKKFAGRTDIFSAGTAAPEDYIGKVSQLRPQKMVIVDCANMGLKPGEYRLIKQSDIAGFNLSTHNVPLKLFLKAVHGHVGRIFLIGIQPKTMGFAQDMSREVRASMSAVTWFIEDLVRPEEEDAGKKK